MRSGGGHLAKDLSLPRLRKEWERLPHRIRGGRGVERRPPRHALHQELPRRTHSAGGVGRRRRPEASAEATGSVDPALAAAYDARRLAALDAPSNPREAPQPSSSPVPAKLTPRPGASARNGRSSDHDRG